MANKKVQRVNLNKERILEIMHSKGLSFRGLGRDPNFQWTEKSIRRAFICGASLILLNDLVTFLDVNVVDIT
jgi:hypothetical protein